MNTSFEESVQPSTFSAKRYPPAGDGARTRALSLHSATVVTISGDVDAANVDRIGDFATRFALVGNAVILDLGGVRFFAARSVSLFLTVDDVCRSADVQWALVPSPAVNRVTRLAECDTALPTASSVPKALQQLTALTRARRQLILLTMPARNHDVQGAP